ncbi:diguanylate cyclase [Vibrio cyclitrophicus 1F289]|uniref:sensor domain-containing diguanylate cyclase n=1 Tax=Vibrio cyclitrophicus TaxID=47951 RepID=UPI000362305F|nr:sensor domain-containing diguanylate cyclase [Vibrio cyclitrophicus]OEF40931.1 diguanylate cyclase [Vibrio cyclitrophicus 1F289]PMF10671.1 diguanylate cyclase [Vibrio cyclitrophicus]
MTKLTINSTYGIAILKDFHLVHADDNYAHIFGYKSAQELMSSIDSILDLIVPDHHQSAKDNYYQQVERRANPRGRTFTNRDRFGREFTAFTIDHVIKWKGEPALQVTLIDLSVQEQALKQLEHNKLQYQRLVLSSLQGISVHRNFKPIMVNQAWVDLMKAPSIEFVLENVYLLDLIYDDQKEEAIARYQNLISSSLPGAHNVIKNICFDGKERYFSIYDNAIEWDGEMAVQAVIEDITDRVELEKELAYKASHDSLTGLLNRDAIYQWVEAQAHQQNTLVCMMLDVDDFKSVNDQHGHLTGDAMLRNIANLCKQVVSNHGVTGRWGGEEFVIFLSNVRLSQAIELAEELRQRCESFVCSTAEENVQRTVSIGVSVCQEDISLAEKSQKTGQLQKTEKPQNEDQVQKSDQVQKANQLIKHLVSLADKFLYQAKSQGKNKVVTARNLDS